jgi:hypothetical protein
VSNSIQKPTPWFSQRYVVAPFVLMLCAYTFIAYFNGEWLKLADKIVSPLVDILRVIGFDIHHPMMDGPISERFYTNIIGIGLWEVFVFNMDTIWWIIVRDPVIGDRNYVTQRLIEKYGMTFEQADRKSRTAPYYAGIPFVVFFIALFLNSLNGWFVWHVNDYFSAIFYVVLWVFSGSFLATLYFVVFKGIVNSFD